MTVSTAASTSLRTSSRCARSAVLPSRPRPAAHLASSSSSSVINAIRWGRRSPTTSACETHGMPLRRFSMFCGETFLPPAVTMMSFLRSVIVRKPSSSISPDVAGVQPAVAGQHRARRLLVLVVAGEDRRPAHEDLAVLGGRDLDAGDGGTDRAELEVMGPVDVRRRRPLRLAVALEHEDVEGVEELGDLLGERRPARDRGPEPSAEPILDLRVDEPVGEAMLGCEPARNRLPPVAEVRSPAVPRAGPSRSAAA